MAESSKSVDGGKVLRRPRRLSVRTAKPYEGFALTRHPSGRWCKKIRGKLHDFGKLDSRLLRFGAGPYHDSSSQAGDRSK